MIEIFRCLVINIFYIQYVPERILNSAEITYKDSGRKELA